MWCHFKRCVSTYCFMIFTHSHIDHGNGLLSLRIYHAIEKDAGLYSCRIFVDGMAECVCLTSTELQISPRARRADSSRQEVCFLKTPLPVIADIEETVTFCARVHPANAISRWFLCGHEIDENDSDQFSVRIRFPPSLCFDRTKHRLQFVSI